jgi:hypothetical protein
LPALQMLRICLFGLSNHRKEPERYVQYVLKFFIDDNKAGGAKIFRLKKYFPMIIIRDDLREKIIKNKITGIDFIDTWELK